MRVSKGIPFNIQSHNFALFLIKIVMMHAYCALGIHILYCIHKLFTKERIL